MASHERNNIVPFKSGYVVTTKSGTSITSNYVSNTLNLSSSYSRMSDSRTPNYKMLKRTGQRLPNRAMRETRHTQTPITAVGTGGSRSGSDWVRRDGTSVHDLFGLSSPIPASSLEPELVLKALNKAKQSSFNAPIFLAEAGKTTDMVLNRLADMRGLVRDLRKGNIANFLKKSEMFHERTVRARRVRGLPGIFPGLTRYPKERERKVVIDFNKDFGRDAALAAGNTWLEWKYGWQSLMMDVEGLAEHIEEVRHKDANLDGVIKTSLTRRHKITGPYSISQTPSIRGVREDTVVLKGTLTCRFKINNPNLLLPAKVGLTNPLSVAWELVPFSFVVDWFIPIGKFIDALDVNFLYTFTDKIIVYKTIFDRKVEVKQHDTFNYSVSGSGHKLLIVKDRDATNMALSFSALNFKNGFANPERIVTSLALLGQSMLGMKHPKDKKSNQAPVRDPAPRKDYIWTGYEP